MNQSTFRESVEKRTSEDWIGEPEFENYTVLDPDGWDRKNFDYSWYAEMITKKEFNRRLAMSTVNYVPEKNIPVKSEKDVAKFVIEELSNE